MEESSAESRKVDVVDMYTAGRFNAFSGRVRSAEVRDEIERIASEGRKLRVPPIFSPIALSISPGIAN
jgi:hypothetical protein